MVDWQRRRVATGCQSCNTQEDPAMSSVCVSCESVAWGPLPAGHHGVVSVDGVMTSGGKKTKRQRL